MLTIVGFLRDKIPDMNMICFIFLIKRKTKHFALIFLFLKILREIFCNFVFLFLSFFFKVRFVMFDQSIEHTIKQQQQQQQKRKTKKEKKNRKKRKRNYKIFYLKKVM